MVRTEVERCAVLFENGSGAKVADIVMRVVIFIATEELIGLISAGPGIVDVVAVNVPETSTNAVSGMSGRGLVKLASLGDAFVEVGRFVYASDRGLVRGVGVLDCTEFPYPGTGFPDPLLRSEKM